MRKVAVFDFDGTITTRDTLFEFLKFTFTRKQIITGFIKLMPHLIRFKLGIISNSLAKEQLFGYFFRGVDADAFDKHGQDFANRIENILYKPAFSRLLWHKQQGHECIIVSASVENWIKPWASKHDLTVLATRAEIADGKITGKFLGDNCYGQEKVNRLQAYFGPVKEYEIFAYGDSKGDKELLAFATYSFYRKFE